MVDKNLVKKNNDALVFLFRNNAAAALTFLPSITLFGFDYLKDMAGTHFSDGASRVDDPPRSGRVNIVPFGDVQNRIGLETALKDACNITAGVEFVSLVAQRYEAIPNI